MTENYLPWHYNSDIAEIYFHLIDIIKSEIIICMICDIIFKTHIATVQKRGKPCKCRICEKTFEEVHGCC